MEARLRWLADGAVVVAALAALVLLAAVLGARVGLWTSRAGFGAFRWAALLALLGAALAAIALVAARITAGPGAGGMRPALAAGALAVSLAVLAVPWLMVQQARRLPFIHDITTDTADPPAFVAVLPLRAGAPNAAVYGGQEVAAAQARAYPDLGPRYLAAAPAGAFEQALQAARGMGWAIVAADPAAGRIEATATTRWLRFKDDVVVRIRPDGGGSRVDVRSASRVGGSDLGMNARRIREYLRRLGRLARVPPENADLGAARPADGTDWPRGAAAVAAPRRVDYFAGSASSVPSSPVARMRSPASAKDPA